MLAPLDGSHSGIDSLIGIAISTRVPTLLSESYKLPPSIGRPAVIRRPESMSSLLAIQNLRQEVDPMGKMARKSRVWDKFDTAEEWKELDNSVLDTNKRALDAAIRGALGGA